MICFDFDGVIADTLQFWEENCRLAAAEQGLELPQDTRPFQRLDPLTFVQLARDLGLDPTIFDDRMAALGRARPVSLAPFPAMAEVLHILADRCPLAVISASRTGFIEGFLNAHGLAASFTTVLGGDRHQGKAAALSQLAPVTAMIGDAKSDIDAARVAGVGSIAALWGWQDHSMLAHADHVAAYPQALPDLIASL